MASGGRQPLLLLCLLLGKVYGQLLEDGAYLVTGTVGGSVTLPCSFTVPENWKDSKYQVIWFRNFTDKLLNCTMPDGRPPVCRELMDSPRTHLSWNVFGNADLHISSLRTADAGPYQCWLFLPDAYRRQDTILRVNGAPVSDPGKSSPPLGGVSQWENLMYISAWHLFLISGWPVALLLLAIFLGQKLSTDRRKSYRCLV